MENIKTITIKDYERLKTLAGRATKSIPDRHCRIKEERFNDELIDLLRGSKERTAGKVKYIAVMENYNQGTARYPHTIKKVCVYQLGDHPRITPKMINWHKKANVLALIK